MRSAALLEAIEIAGGPAALGAGLGIRSQAISQWTQAPVTRVLDIERLTGVSRFDLRPDIYPRGPAPRRRAVPAPADAAE